MWRHKLWNRPFLSNQAVIPTWPKSQHKNLNILTLNPPPQEDDGGQFYQGLRDLKCSSTPGGLSQMGGLKFLHFSGGQQGFLYWGDRRSPYPNGQELLILPTRKSLPSRLPPTKFLFPLPKVHFPQPTKFNFSIENIFFQSSIMISKMHWSIKWTVV